jgi:hypothetical protein
MYGGNSQAEGWPVSQPDDANGGIMGVFDKVVKDAEEAMAREDPGLAQQAGQFGGDQAGQDMRAARSLIGKQRGAREQGHDHDHDHEQVSDQDRGDQDDIGEDW